jgi:DNA primase
MLADILRQQGYILEREGGGNYRVQGFQGLIVKDNYWYQHSTQQGGHASALLSKLANNQQKIALDFQNKIHTIREYPFRYSRNTDGFEPPILNYLVRERKIDKELVEMLIQKKLISWDHRNICFLGYDENGNIQCVTRRSTLQSSVVPKSEAKGSDKKFSFTMPAAHDAASVIITEGPIDALSVACMENRKHQKGYFETTKIALCGNIGYDLQDRLSKLKPRQIWLALDYDATGRNMTRNIYNDIHSIAPTRIVSFPYGKDPNDWLRYRIAHSI